MSDSHAGLNGLRFRLAPEHLALLFALFGQAPPPLVGDAMAGLSAATLRERLAEIEVELIDRGVFRPGADGSPDLDESAADLLSVCFDADEAITAEVGGSVLSTAYLREERTVVVSADGDDVVLLELGGPDGRSGWLLSALGESDHAAVGPGLSLDLAIEQLDELLRAATEGGLEELEGISAANGWDAEVLIPVLAGLVGGSGAVSMTAVRPGSPEIVVSRVLRTQDGAWVLRIFAQGLQDRAELAWQPTSALLAVVCDSDES
jgi:hypothetical protein